ncbi:hypothetical protein D3C72_2415250 [compost metagenome]
MIIQVGRTAIHLVKIEINHLFQCFEASVMHIWCCKGNIAQGRDPHFAYIFRQPCRPGNAGIRLHIQSVIAEKIISQ